MTIRRLSFLSVAVAGAVALFYIAAGALVVTATEALLVLFVAVLYGIFLRHTGRWVSDRTPISHAAGVGLSAAIQVLLAAAVLWFAGGQIGQQVQSAVSNIDDARQAARDQIAGFPRLEQFLKGDPNASALIGYDQSEQSSKQDQTSSKQSGRSNESSTDDQKTESSDQAERSPSTDTSGATSSLASRTAAGAKTAVTATFGALANLLIVFFVGLYLALDPGLYRDGFLKLLPASARSTACDVFGQLDVTLWRWMVGRFATMAITGVGVAITLWLISVPMPITLGIITGLLTFVPNIGPVIALSLAVLVALPKGMTTVGLTVAGYVAFQLIESYLLTPMIQKRQIAMPPALILIAQLLMGVIAGFLGIAVATPLVAVLIVVVSILYIEKHHDEERSLDDLPGVGAAA